MRVQFPPPPPPLRWRCRRETSRSRSKRLCAGVQQLRTMPTLPPPVARPPLPRPCREGKAFDVDGMSVTIYFFSLFAQAFPFLRSFVRPAVTVIPRVLWCGCSCGWDSAVAIGIRRERISERAPWRVMVFGVGGREKGWERKKAMKWRRGRGGEGLVGRWK